MLRGSSLKHDPLPVHDTGIVAIWRHRSSFAFLRDLSLCPVVTSVAGASAGYAFAVKLFSTTLSFVFKTRISFSLRAWRLCAKPVLNYLAFDDKAVKLESLQANQLIHISSELSISNRCYL